MSGKENRHEHAGKKKHMVNQAEREEEQVEQNGGNQDKEQLTDDLKAFEERSNEMQAQLKAFEEKTQEMHDKYLRLSAEFDNYRKRTMKEKTEIIKTASEDLMIKIIPVVDDIERGIKAMNESNDPDAVREGMNLIYARFKEFLQQNGVKEIEAVNQDFNTDVHEAVTKIPASDENQKGKVVDVIQKGYMLHDKVIRYPKVVVGE
jgi:molecular chaperone GrpE